MMMRIIRMRSMWIWWEGYYNKDLRWVPRWMLPRLVDNQSPSCLLCILKRCYFNVDVVANNHDVVIDINKLKDRKQKKMKDGKRRKWKIENKRKGKIENKER
jgi:hypothetical protein